MNEKIRAAMDQKISDLYDAVDQDGILNLMKRYGEWCRADQWAKFAKFYQLDGDKILIAEADRLLQSLLGEET